MVNGFRKRKMISKRESIVNEAENKNYDDNYIYIDCSNKSVRYSIFELNYLLHFVGALLLDNIYVNNKIIICVKLVKFCNYSNDAEIIIYIIINSI